MAWVRNHLFLSAFLAIFIAGLLGLTLFLFRGASPEPQHLNHEDLGKFEVREISGLSDKRIAALIGQTDTRTRPAQPGRVHYFADGYSLADSGSENRQATWVCMFNPTNRSVKVRFTFYYLYSNPTHLEYDLPAEVSQSINLYNCEQVRRNERFGAKIESSERIVAQITTGYYGKADKKDWYTRAMNSMLCNDTISNTNYYIKGMGIENRGSFLEDHECMFLLNPNDKTAKVVFQTYTAEGPNKAYSLIIKPQRLFLMHLDDPIKISLLGAKFLSNVPIVIQQTQWTEEKDGKTIRSSSTNMAQPWQASRGKPMKAFHSFPELPTDR